MRFDRALADVINRAGIPYGYTLTIWCAGALLVHRFGSPGLTAIFLFLAGATVGYGVLAVVTWPARREKTSLPPMAIWENGLALPAVAVTYGISQAAGNASLGYFVAPATATIVYLAGLSASVWFVCHLGRAPAHRQ